MELDSLFRIVLIVAGIGAIIFVHELGHFLVAKLARVRVEGFSLGFPPTGVGFRRTDDGLRTTVLPNFFSYYPCEVGGIQKDSPAEEAGLRLGDKILTVNGLQTERLGYEGLGRCVGELWARGEEVTFLVDRQGEDLTLGPLKAPPTPDLMGFGLFPHLAWQKSEIGSGDAWAFGLDPGERVTAVGNRSMLGRDEFQKFCLEAISQGTGVVRFHIQGGTGPDGEAGREIAYLIQRPMKRPSFIFVLPFLGGKEGQTEYRLSLIPVGGYVKMAGDAPGEGEGSPDEFLQKSVGARAAIIAAGSVMNIVFALFVFIVAFQIGVRFSAPVVGMVAKDGPADKAGIRQGDRIVRINGNVITAFLDIPSEVAFSDPEEGTLFEIERPGEGGKERMSIRVFPERDEKAGRLEVGIYPSYSSLVQGVEKDSPLHAGGLRPKDRIVSVGNREVSDRLSLYKALQSVQEAGKKEFAFTVERDGRVVDPMRCVIPGEVKRVWRIGITPEMFFLVEEAGEDAVPFQPGDEILTVNGEPIRGGLFDTVEEALGETRKGRIVFGIRRDGKEREEGRNFFGIPDTDSFRTSLRAPCRARVTYIGEESDFRRVGGTVGDLLVRIGGTPFESLEEMQEMIQASAGSPLDVTWKNDKGVEKSSVLHPLGQWNATPAQLGIAELMVVTEDLQLSFADSIVVGVKKSIKFAGDVFKMLKGIFTKQLSPKNLGGPVLILKASYHFAEHGLGKLLFFLGILGVNLGIINLFPIPILDGGHLVFLAIEKIKGSPVSEPVQLVAQYAGLLILLLLMIYVTWQDIQKIFAS
jgi:regulator of sigma E protease